MLGTDLKKEGSSNQVFWGHWKIKGNNFIMPKGDYKTKGNNYNYHTYLFLTNHDNIVGIM
jgi:hypothetical protein